MIKVKIFSEGSFRILEAKMNDFFEKNEEIERTDIIKMEFEEGGAPICRLVYEVR